MSGGAVGPGGIPSRLYEDRQTYVRVTVQENTDNAGFSAKDLSAGTVAIYFRAWTVPAGTTFVINTELAAVNTGSDGKFAGFVKPTSAYGALDCRIVFSDEAVVDAATPSGYRERVLSERLNVPVVASVQPSG